MVSSKYFIVKNKVMITRCSDILHYVLKYSGEPFSRCPNNPAASGSSSSSHELQTKKLLTRPQLPI